MHQSGADVGLVFIRCQIVGWTYDRSPPGFVEIELADRHGDAHRYTLKFYDVSNGELDQHSTYPQEGVLVCEIIRIDADASGRAFVELGAVAPFRTDGPESFEIYVDQLLPLTRQLD